MLPRMLDAAADEERRPNEDGKGEGEGGGVEKAQIKSDERAGERRHRGADRERHDANAPHVVAEHGGHDFILAHRLESDAEGR